MSKQLSDEALAILTVAAKAKELNQYPITAVLYALADLVVPQVSYSMESPWQVGFADRDAQLRSDIIKIANELQEFINND